MGIKESVVAVVVLAVIVSSTAVGIVMATSDGNDSKVEEIKNDPVSCSITYVMNGGTNSSDNPSSYVQGTGTELKDPVREGYTFTGWYTDQELTKKITAVSGDSTGDLTIYAGWEEIVVPVVSYSITFVMNGGTNSSDNPSSYTQGSAIELKDPVRDGYIFIGWYTDEGLTNEITTISNDSTGDLTIYAGWEECMVGKKISFAIAGTVTNHTKISSQVANEITGTIHYSYLRFDYSKGYLMQMDETYTVTSGLMSNTYTDTNAYWTSENDSEWTKGDIKTIETAFGSKECQTWISKEENSTETQYVGDDDMTYLIEYTRTEGNWIMTTVTTITYTLTEIGNADLADEFDVNVYCDKDITVSGDGTCTAYEDVTLTASGDSFSGWYDESGELLSKERTYTITKFVSDVTVYARNNNDSDLTFDTATPTISAPVQLTGITWTFTDGTEKVIASDNLTYTFTSPGNYTLYYIGTLPQGGTYFGIVDVFIDSLVTRTYNWTYDGDDYEIVLEIRYSDYLTYRNDTYAARHQMYTGLDSIYFTTNDPYIEFIASKLEEFSEDHDSQLWKANLILTFVQSTDYVTDQVSRGQDEFWKYPLETLYDMNGDCEDTSFLFATIAKKMGFDCCVILYSGHMAAGITLDDGTGYYYTNGTKQYYYCETTSDTMTVGAEPGSGYRQNNVQRFIVVP